jgi:hypothetical protein
MLQRDNDATVEIESEAGENNTKNPTQDKTNAVCVRPKG